MKLNVTFIFSALLLLVLKLICVLIHCNSLLNIMYTMYTTFPNVFRTKFSLEQNIPAFLPLQVYPLLFLKTGWANNSNC